MTREQVHAEFGMVFYVDISSKEMAASIMRLLLDEPSFDTSLSFEFSVFNATDENVWSLSARYLRIADGLCMFYPNNSFFRPTVPDYEFLAFLQGKTLYEPGTDFDLAFQKLMME